MLAKDSAQVFGPNEIIAKVGSKAARKVYYEQTNRSTRNETTTQHRPTKRQKIVTPLSSISGNSYTNSSQSNEKKDLKEYLCVLRERVSVMTDLEEPKDKIAVVRREILKVLDKLAEVIYPIPDVEGHLSPFDMQDDDFDLTTTVALHESSSSSTSRRV